MLLEGEEPSLGLGAIEGICCITKERENEAEALGVELARRQARDQCPINHSRTSTA